MSEFEVRLDEDGEVIDAKRDVTVINTANPFGNKAEIHIEDDIGTEFDKFEFGRRVEIYARPQETQFEVQNARDKVIQESETLKVDVEETTVEETDTQTVEETETEETDILRNQGIVANQGIYKTNGPQTEQYRVVCSGRLGFLSARSFHAIHAGEG